MERFTGQPLPQAPHLAVLFYDAIGDFVVATPLLRGLREKYPGCTVDYYGGERSRQLEEASPLIDSRFSVFGDPDAVERFPSYLAERRRIAGPYDLVVNCDDHPALAVVASALDPRYVVGRCLDRELRADLPPAQGRVEALYMENWADSGLLNRCGDILHSQYIAEVFCRLAYVETEFGRTEVPDEPPPIAIPDILISTGGKRSAKLWPTRHWLSFLEYCRLRGHTIGLLGDSPSRQRRQYHAGDVDDLIVGRSLALDLRGRLTLPHVCGALRRARACVTIDNGIMHLAGATGVPTLALFGASPWRLWAPPVPHLRVVLGTDDCSLCEENRYRNESCLRDRQVCLESLTPEMVLAQLDDLLASKGAPA